MTRPAPFRLLAPGLAILLVAASGCRPSSSSSGHSAKTQSTLSVKSTAPGAGAEGVSPSVTISITFSSAIDFGTVDATSFAVKGSVSGPIGGAYAYEPSSRRLRFTPSEELVAGEKITVRLSSAILTPKKSPLVPADLSFSIATDTPEVVPIPDPGPFLRVSGTNPAASANGVPRSERVTVRFSEPVLGSSITADSVVLRSGLTGRVPSRVSLSSDGLELTIAPERDLSPCDEVSVQVSGSIESSSGSSFNGWAFQFRTEALPPPTEAPVDHVHATLGRVSILEKSDLNLDGNADLVQSSENETFVDLLLGRGDGTFALGIRIDVLQPVLSLALQDLDSDGDSDLLVGTADRVRTFFSLFRESGASAGAEVLRFAAGPEAPTGSAVRGICVADLDHEGLLDVVLDTDRGLRVYLGGIDARPVQTIGASRQARTGLVAGDLDLDGSLDLVHGDRKGGRLTWYPGTGLAPAPLGEARHFELGADAGQVAIADLSGDSHPEIIALLEGGPLGAEIHVLRWTASGYASETFAAFTEPFGSPEPAAGATLERSRFTIADMDGNGQLDLLLADEARGVVVGYPNTPGGIDFAGGGARVLGFPEALLPVACDLNGDGSLDVAAAGRSEIHALVIPPPASDPVPEVDPAAGRFELSIDDSRVHQGESNANLLVRATHSLPLQAYSVSLGFNGAAIAPGGVSTEGTVTGESRVEFSNFSHAPSSESLSYSVVVEFSAPFEGRVIPAGESQLLFRFVFNVLADAPLGDSAVRFLESAGEPPVRTSFFVDSRSVAPRAQDGKVTVLEPIAGTPSNGDRMRIGEAYAKAGGEGRVPVLGNHDKRADAFTTIFTFDPRAIEVLDLDLAGSAVESLLPDIFIPDIDNAAGKGSMTVIFDITPPIEGIGLTPGVESILFFIHFRVRAEAETGEHVLGFENQSGSPPLNNIFVVDGKSVFPDLVEGAVIVEPETGARFIRGNVDGGASVDLGDAIALTNFLFRGGAVPACLDAGDTNDNGKLELTDPILLLNHLFKAGPAPAPPYPAAGFDPTPDGLSCLRGS